MEKKEIEREKNKKPTPTPESQSNARQARATIGHECKHTKHEGKTEAESKYHAGG